MLVDVAIQAAESGVKRRRAPRGSGDQLRDEILEATTELLLETGHAKAVSIRAVAQRVGVGVAQQPTRVRDLHAAQEQPA